MRFQRLISIFAICVLAATAQTSWAQDSTWTLQRCLDVAAKQSPRLIASRRSVAAAQAASGESAANRLPTLGVGGNYSYASKVQELSIPLSLPIPGFTSPNIKMGDGNVYDMTATIKAPLYSGGTLVESSRASSAAAIASKYDLATDSLGLAYSVRRAYYNALGAQSRLDAARNSAARIQRNLQSIVDAQKVGANNEENRITALSRLRQTEELVINSDNQARAARLLLGSLVLEPGAEIAPAGHLDSTLIDSAAPNLVPLAARNEVAAADARIEQSRHLTRASSGSLLPSLSANAVYHYSKPGLNAIKNDWMNYYTVGLSASWTLWDWHARSYRIAQTRASREALEARREDLVTTLRTRYQTALDALTAARAVRDKATEHTGLERQRMTMVEGRLKLGAATETEFLDAQDDLTAAETDLASAIATLRIAEADLLYAAGY